MGVLSIIAVQIFVSSESLLFFTKLKIFFSSARFRVSFSSLYRFTAARTATSLPPVSTFSILATAETFA
ncbi:hypothetical protein HZC09_05115 [Candidatus Micrarchaeota archaeon]|nr:hypothetical protein [Candidatus Micrarchaeota archaeon]